MLNPLYMVEIVWWDRVHMLTSPGTSLSRTLSKISPKCFNEQMDSLCIFNTFFSLHCVYFWLAKGKNTNEFKVNGVLVMHELISWFIGENINLYFIFIFCYLFTFISTHFSAQVVYILVFFVAWTKRFSFCLDNKWTEWNNLILI